MNAKCLLGLKFISKYSTFIELMERLVLNLVKIVGSFKGVPERSVNEGEERFVFNF